MAKLILRFKGVDIKEFLLEKTSITIGRDPKNDIVIDNLAVSRFHTKITQHGNNYFAEDLQSGNGTFLNEQRIDKEILKHNDAITVGKHTLVFMYDPVFPATELDEAATSLLEETVIVSSESPYGRADAEGALSAHLVLLISGTPHQSVPLTKLVTLGGKSAQADIKLRGFFVGDVAFSISKTPRGFVISHAGGRRRTRVNGEVVKRQRELLEGDIITTGPTKFRFSMKSQLVG